MPPGLSTKIKIGHDLKFESASVKPVSWVAEDGTRIKLVDTPGFDGITDKLVFKIIETFLAKE